MVKQKIVTTVQYCFILSNFWTNSDEHFESRNCDYWTTLVKTKSYDRSVLSYPTNYLD